MKISQSGLRTLLVAAAVVATAGIASARLRYQERQLLEAAVNDQTYGDTLADQLDSPWSLSFSWRGVLLGSNDVLTVTAKSPVQNHPTWSDLTVATARAALSCIVTSDSKGYAPASVLAFSQGTNGNYLETVTGKAFTLILSSNGKGSIGIRSTNNTNRYVQCVEPITGKLDRSVAGPF